MLKGKKIILGITGSIAAYKAAFLLRLLVKEGAEVQVVMTELAKEFITPLTMATLSKNPILVDFFDPENGSWNSHVDLGLWADLYLIAPATANTMAKMATGVADNLLLTTYLSARCPVAIVPAMDLDMFQHPATQKNIAILQSFGNTIIEPSTGELASGLEGKGRMEEPEIIVEFVKNNIFQKKKLSHKKILITAGPTFEPIDPVRFIGNHSSGKMGYAIAEECALQGAEVYLVSGPVPISVKLSSIKVIQVNSANEMYLKCIQLFPQCHVAILSAAVADYRPKTQAAEKIKKETNNLTLELEPTEDIAFELGKMKTGQQVTIGFALETTNEENNANTKLKKKNFDFIVLNSLNDKGAGFKTDTNKISIIEKNNKSTNFELKSKTEVAKDIVQKLIEYL